MEESQNHDIEGNDNFLERTLNINTLELLRLCNAMKVSEVCENVGISVQHLRDIERDIRNPSRKVLLKLLDTYHVSEDVYKELVETKELIKNKEPLKRYQVLLWTTLAKLM